MHTKENRNTVNRPCDPNFHRPKHVNKTEEFPGSIDNESNGLPATSEDMQMNTQQSHEMDDKAHGEAQVQNEVNKMEADRELENAKQMLEEAVKTVANVKEKVRKATQARMDRATRLAQQAVQESSATRSRSSSQPSEMATGVNPLPGASEMTVTDASAFHGDEDAEAEEMLARSCEELEQAQRAFEEVQAQVKRATQARAAEVKALSSEVDKSVARQEQVEPRTGADEVEATLQRGIEKVDEGTSWLADKVLHAFDPIDTRKEYPKGADAEPVPP